MKGDDVICVINNSATLDGTLFTLHASQVPIDLPTLSAKDKEVGDLVYATFFDVFHCILIIIFSYNNNNQIISNISLSVFIFHSLPSVCVFYLNNTNFTSILKLLHSLNSADCYLPHYNDYLPSLADKSF